MCLLYETSAYLLDHWSVNHFTFQTHCPFLINVRLLHIMHYLGCSEDLWYDVVRYKDVILPSMRNALTFTCRHKSGLNDVYLRRMYCLLGVK
jgi:hypothetical protein